MSYDLVVLGGGAAGLTCTVSAAKMGARVLLVERERLGGECTFTGCIPSKALLYAARLAHQARHGAALGVRATVEVDFPRVMEHVRRSVAAFDKGPGELEGMGAEVVFGQPRFVGPRELEVEGRRIRFSRAVICTGSSPAVPRIEGLEEAGYLTNLNVFQLPRLPRRLLVVGGGPIGCELAQAFSRLGSEVTLVQRNERLLPRDDREASRVLQQVFQAEGIRVRLETELVRLAREGDVRRGTLRSHQGVEDQVECEEVLMAVGRRANTEGLDLAAAEVELNEAGYVRADSRLRTTNSGIWACGDVHGKYQFTHVADYEAKLVAAQALLRLPLKPDYRAVPWTTFTDPEVARVGELEGERTWTIPVREVHRSITEAEVPGFYKLVTGARGRGLGATIMAREAGELIHEVILAVHSGMKASQLSRAIHVYPTRALGVRRAADLYTVENLAPRWAIKLVQKLFGYRTDRTP